MDGKLRRAVSAGAPLEGERESLVLGSEHDTTAALKELTSWWRTWTGDYEKECVCPGAWAQETLPGRRGVC